MEPCDNRVFQRFPARFPTRFRHGRTSYGTDVFLKDASGAGLKVASKLPFYLNDKISLEVKLPDHPDPLVLHGSVVWKQQEQAKSWILGVTLQGPNLMQLQRMFKFVESLDDGPSR